MWICSKALGLLSGHEAGRQLLAEMYRAQIGAEMPQIAVADRGKPYFVTGNVHFSLSHTKRRVFCVLADVPVGIDAEEADRDIDLCLAEKILSPVEKLRYEAAPDKRTALLRLWVLKEAAAKATGEGLRGYPNQTDFDPNDTKIQEMNGCLVAAIESKEMEK